MHFFDEVKDYMGFEQTHADTLQTLRPTVEPHFEDIVANFYDELWQHDHTKNIFDGPEQIDRLESSLHDWLEDIFTGPYDNEYFQHRKHVGLVHYKIGLKPEFMFGAMNLIRSDLIEILREESIEPPLSKAIKSVETILDLDLTVILQSYWDRTMEKKLESASSLAAGLAHEILNPLNSIGLNLTLLERRLESDLDSSTDYTKMLDSVRSELQRVSSLAQEIKDFSKPMDISPRWHDAKQIMSELQQVHGATLEASDIELAMDISDDSAIYCDIDRLKQVFVNLLKNSIEAIEPPGTVQLKIENKDAGTSILIEDDGEGMDPSTQYQIFDLFFTTKASGTGIGLPVVKKIIDAHDGSISVTSNRGQGTRFTISLPRPEKSSSSNKREILNE
jgi:signal transduction histidine kinase